MPSIAFSDSNSIEAIAERVVHDSLVPLFHKLHPDASDWDLSLINVCATNMSQLASDDRDGAGRDISSMFRRQVEVLKEWTVKDDISDDLNVSSNEDVVLDTPTAMTDANISEEVSHENQEDEEKFVQPTHSDEDALDSEEAVGVGEVCEICGAYMPVFAIVAHERFHSMAD
jgi:DNA polymerase iota